MLVMAKQGIEHKMSHCSISKTKKKFIPLHKFLNTAQFRTFKSYRLIFWRRKQGFTQFVGIPVLNALDKLYSPVNLPRGSREIATTAKGFILSEKTNRQEMDDNELASLFQKCLCLSEAKAKETVANKKVSSILIEIIQFVSFLVTTGKCSRK
jgi:hypothetical protein